MIVRYLNWTYAIMNYDHTVLHDTISVSKIKCYYKFGKKFEIKKSKVFLNINWYE